MKRSEFLARIPERMRANWPHSDLPDATFAAMWDTIGDLPVDQVLAAVETLHREGREFAPTGGMIRMKVVDLATDAPDWPAVKRAIRGCLAYGERVFSSERGFVNEREQRLQQQPDLVRRFVGRLGWAEVAAAADSEDTTAEAQLRTKWDRFVAGDKGDQALAGLPSAGLARLDRVNAERGQIGAGTLKQIDGGQ